MKNKILTFSLFKIFRIENIFKNTLIFFPLLLSDRSANTSDVIALIGGFLVFTSMTMVCYATNDFTDYKKDLLNKLKAKKKILEKNAITTLNFFLILFLLLCFYYTNLINIYLIFYLIFFYLYNFLTKNFFLIDIVFLTSFYILRLYYGSELIGINISYWFLFFFTTFFLIFSTFKRIIQISMNNLVSKNKIIAYSQNHYSLLKKIVIISTIVNLFIFILYLYELTYPDTFASFSAPETRYEQNILTLYTIFFLYSFGLIRIIRLVFNKKIKQDIYLFALKDKLNYVFLIGYFLFVFFYIN